MNVMKLMVVALAGWINPQQEDHWLAELKTSQREAQKRKQTTRLRTRNRGSRRSPAALSGHGPFYPADPNTGAFLDPGNQAAEKIRETGHGVGFMR